MGWWASQYFWENRIDGNQTTNQLGFEWDIYITDKDFHGIYPRKKVIQWDSTNKKCDLLGFDQGDNDIVEEKRSLGQATKLHPQKYSEFHQLQTAKGHHRQYQW